MTSVLRRSGKLGMLLEQSKAAVLNTLASAHSRRSYECGIERFIAWPAASRDELRVIKSYFGPRNRAARLDDLVVVAERSLGNTMIESRALQPAARVL